MACILLRKLVLATAALLILSGGAAAQRYAMGEVFDEAAYNALPLKAKVSSRSILPPAASLEAYCPTPGDQGEFGTCAAWSSAYHFRTIIEAKQRGLTDRAQIDEIAYSPTWVYEILKSEQDDTCGGGMATAQSLELFKQFGVPSYSSLPFACMSGTREERIGRLERLAPEAANARIRDLQILFFAKETTDPQLKIDAIKKVIAEGYPVLVSHTLFNSFFRAKDVWRPAAGESLADEHGSHAMVIVGYDDQKFGGAFRYLNSWGTGWGDGGFLWVPYAVTGELCYGAYQAFPYARATPGPGPAPKPAACAKPAADTKTDTERRRQLRRRRHFRHHQLRRHR